MRRLLTLPFALLSLLLFLATTSLWIRSYFIRDIWMFAREQRETASGAIDPGKPAHHYPSR